LPFGYAVWLLSTDEFYSVNQFCVLAYQASQQSRQTEMFIYGALALLFQPFFKIALGRELWNIVDVIVGVGLLVSLAKNNKK
jgi:hypothetical protein